ncbi:titin-like isoform X1 [Vanessa atalanta]|uniref:titin-like isoform X1 n=1 Tax=Vanessa atalanta TaxID=42275 RepID=UPI001FCDB44A|nr:titin-like isoform X1 [Vanessa atalanta]
MSDNEDLLGDDLGDHSLADYNLGNEEEEQLLADDYDSGPSQNVPSSNNSSYSESVDTVPTRQSIEYTQPVPYTPEPECVVPNIVVEVPNMPQTEHTTYAPFNEPYEQEHAVPPAIPAAPAESPQIVPSEMAPAPKPASQRSPRARNIPDSLDKVFVPRNSYNGRGRSSWRNPHYRQNHPYRRNNTFRGNFGQRPSFPPPHIRPQIPNQPPIRPDIPEHRPDLPQMDRELSPERPLPPQEMIQPSNPQIENQPYNQNFQRFQFRNDERPNFGPNIRPNFERPMFYQRPYNPRQFGPRDMMPNNMPQVIRQPLPVMTVNLPKGREPEVRMLPVLPPNLPNLPPGGLAGKKVLINPHFKGNFQPPVEGLPRYVPTRIQKSPPLSPTLESKFGPIKDIDDAAERFIAEQRSALARAQRRHRAEPQRYIENTTIEIENDLARSCEDRELLRKQEEFINANRAGLRRRMRSPSPPRSPSPRRSPERRPRPCDEESEYRRRVREQESLRERVLRAKELRRRKNAAAASAAAAAPREPARDKDHLDKEVPKEEIKQTDVKDVKQSTVYANDTQQVKPDTTRKTPEREKETEVVEEKKEKRDRSPIKVVESAEANSTCETLTPPPPSPERGATPPLPPPARAAPAAPAGPAALDSDDDLDLILDDIDDILSDDDDSGRFKEKASKDDVPKTVEKQVDLRSKLPPKVAEPKKPRQKITFNDNNEDKKKKDKSPVRRVGLGSNKTSHAVKADTKTDKEKSKVEVNSITIKSRQKITFDKKDSGRSARRVVLRAAPDKSVFARIDADPSQPTPCIFSRAVRTAIAPPAAPAAPPAPAAPAAPAVLVRNLPPGITDTRLRTLAAESQSLSLDKEERSAIIIFKTGLAAENFKKKFNNKMVAASRLTVTLQ